MDLGLINLNKSTQELTFEFGDNPPIFKGLNNLVQIVLISLLTDPGSDKFDEFGGGLLRLLGQPVDINDLTDVRSTITVITTDTETQILAEQDNSTLPSDERLNRIELLDVRLSSDFNLEIDISIVNEDGNKAFVTL